MIKTHQPVLLHEALDGLNLLTHQESYYIDATFGRGGHSDAILSAIGTQGHLLVIDQDPTAIEVAKTRYKQDERVYIRQGSFSHLKQWVEELGWNKQINGILLDLGVSSPQLDDKERGFSFQQEGPLDMRMNPTQGINAATWLAHAKENEISKVLYEYGEERFARRIARAIATARKKAPIK